MAAYTSTQNGNWNDAATWGGSGVAWPQVAGDTAVVRHDVTYDAGMSSSTVLGDVTCYAGGGTLIHSGEMHINGVLTIDGGGCLHQKPGSKIYFTGASGDNHGVHFENEADASHIAEGSDPLPTTQLTAAHDIGDTVLTVDLGTGSNFVAGDWIAIYDCTSTDTADYAFTKYQDEGVWVHDVDGDNIYFRWFVGPDDVTITGFDTNAIPSEITVTNSKVFRVNQSIIFGTGNNRNVCRIASIDYTRHTLKLKNLANENAYALDADPSIANAKVYVTGLHKPHSDNSRVRKCATSVTTAINSTSATTVTVGDATGIVAGDVIVVECALQTTDGTTSNRDYNAIECRHIVDSVSGDTITLTGQIGYTVGIGSLVVKLNRDIIIGAKKTGSTDLDASTNICHYYIEHTSSTYDRYIVLKDVWFHNVGNSNHNYRAGFVMRGYGSTDNLPVTLANTTKIQTMPHEPWVEGVSVMINDNGRRDYSGMWGYDFRNSCFRACVSVNGQDAFTVHWDPSQRLYNCFGARCSNRFLRVQGTHYNHEVAYCYGNRVGGRAIYYEPVYNAGRGMHNIKINCGDTDPIRLNRHTGYSGSMWAIDIKDSLYQGPYMSEVGEGKFVCFYSRFRAIEDVLGKIRMSGSAYAGRPGYSSGTSVFRVVEADFEYDKVVNYSYYMRFEWDADQQAYFCQRTLHDDHETPGITEIFMLPPNATARVRFTAKGTANWSGTEPYAYVQTVHNILGGYSGADSGDPFGSSSTTEWISMQTQGSTQQQFADANFPTAWENIDLTVDPQPFSRMIEAGVMAYRTDMSNTDGEGFYMKPIDIRIDVPYAHRDMHLSNAHGATTTPNVRLGSTHGVVTRRFGGMK